MPVPVPVPVPVLDGLPVCVPACVPAPARLPPVPVSRRSPARSPSSPMPSPPQAFDHEKLDAFDAAIEFVAIANTLTKHLPRGSSHLTDQLHRASISIPLNIAEGAGEYSGREKARFYRIAKRSATECAAVLKVCERLGLALGSDLVEGGDLLLRLVSMLTRMIRQFEKGER